jgi:AraC family transcriptional regulator
MSARDASGFFGTTVRAFRGSSFLMTERRFAARDRVPQHEHARAYVNVLIAGGFRERSGREERDCLAHAVLVYPRGMRHSSEYFARDSHCIVVELDDSWSNLGAFDAPRIVHGGAVAAIGERLHAESMLIDDATDMAIEGCLLSLCAAMHRRAQPDDRAAPWLRRACERIDDAPHERPSIAQLAAEAGVHPAHFARAFRQRYGCSVGTYMRAARLRLVRELIASGRPLAEVAIEAGFTDQSHFTRAFRNAEGMTPAAFQRHARSAPRMFGGYKTRP